MPPDTVQKYHRLRLLVEISTYSSPFLEENRLLSQSQFGFRLKLSTSTALIAFTDQVLEKMDKGCVTGTVLLDLRKAFDPVDHLLLINKLKSLGVAGKSLEWLSSYLTGRVQQTKNYVNALSPSAKMDLVYCLLGNVDRDNGRHSG